MADRAAGSEPWDVIVVGAGPAGAAAAATLAGFGRRVLLVEQFASAPSFKLGESIPPTSIGLIEALLAPAANGAEPFDQFYRTAGNVSRWIDTQADVANFFYSAPGYGLCIHRLAFDETLRRNAVVAGAHLLKGARFDGCERAHGDGANWRVTLAVGAQAQHHRSRFLVDASGRRAVVGRALGVAVIADDPLFAFAQTFSCPDEDDDRYTRIEAAPCGWWYSNRLPAGGGNEDGDNETRRIVVLHADRDTEAARMAAHPDGFGRLLRGSDMESLLDTKGYRPAGKIRGAPAGSQRLAECTGSDWLAIGDAAQAYDPLSSQGIDKALRSASHAAHMIEYTLSECCEKLGEPGWHAPYIARYDQQQQELWRSYQPTRDHFYGLQPRWPDQPFWQRRRAR